MARLFDYNATILGKTVVDVAVVTASFVKSFQIHTKIQALNKHFRCELLTVIALKFFTITHMEHIHSRIHTHTQTQRHTLVSFHLFAFHLF